ncbi:MAG TPA: RDD family protein [Gammaproteobacteria bacterium]|nr:RDD family protein [Gammaproteobacteria bacterium]
MSDADKLPKPANLPRRLAALFYDSLLLLAIWFIATAILLPLTDGAAIHAGNPLFSTYLLFISFFFYGWFWTHGGQTLGMRAWRLQLDNLRPGPITWMQALLRFMVAIPAGLLLGTGYLWMLVDKQKLTWHDRYSETCIVQLKENPGKRVR